jgi:hypothetical protein
MRGCERAEHLHHQAARPAQKHRVLDPQRAGAWCRIPGRHNPPEFCHQRRRYRPFKFAADRLDLTLQPGHVLGRQRGPIRLLVSRLQQRPHAQQPIWLFYPVGRALAGRLADDDSEPPGRSGTVIARLPSACGLRLLDAARVPAGGRNRPGAFVPHRCRKVPGRDGHIARLSLIICRPGCTQEGRTSPLLVPLFPLREVRWRGNCRGREVIRDRYDGQAAVIGSSDADRGPRKTSGTMRRPGRIAGRIAGTGGDCGGRCGSVRSPAARRRVRACPGARHHWRTSGERAGT